MNAKDKNYWNDLYQYKFCKITEIPYNEVAKHKIRDDAYVYESSELNAQSPSFLCEHDEYVTNRILIRIFKCVNFIKNFIIASLACGIAYFVITFIQRNS